MINNRKVLVVEPDRMMREVLASIMRDAKLEVIEAADGEEAVECLSMRPTVGLVVTELSLPKLNGDELLRIMRDADLNAPVVFFTLGVPPCFNSIPGIRVFDKLDDPAKLIRYIKELAA